MRITETDLRRVFQASLWLKGGHSLAEVLGGLALTFLNHDLIVRIATALTRAELIEDARDLVANAVRNAAEGFTTDAQFSRPGICSATARSSWCWSRRC